MCYVNYLNKENNERACTFIGKFNGNTGIEPQPQFEALFAQTQPAVAAAVIAVNQNNDYT